MTANFRHGRRYDSTCAYTDMPSKATSAPARGDQTDDAAFGKYYYPHGVEYGEDGTFSAAASEKSKTD